MNPDDLKHIARPIETADSSERAFLLDERITQMSLFYADKRLQETRKDNPDYKFSEAITSHTPIVSDIKRVLYNLDGFMMDDYKDQVNLFFKDLFEKIDSVHEVEGLNMDKIMELIEPASRSLKQYLGVENLVNRKKEEKDQGTKILNFNQISNIEGDDGGRLANLIKLGFSKFDKFMEVHVASIYKTGQDVVGPDLIKEDLAVIASNIVDHAPETVAVVGISWLLSTPLLERLGFKRNPLLEDAADEDEETSYSTWAQFIDIDGQINKKRFNKFCETGKMPFKSVMAYIPVEEFLKRYLPKERRGKIILKSINKEMSATKLELEKYSTLTLEKWSELILGNMDFNTFIESECVKNLFTLFAPEHIDIFQNFLSEMYDKKIPWNEFKNHLSEKLKIIIKAIENKNEDSLYVEREVVVE